MAKFELPKYSAYIPHERVPYVDDKPSLTRSEFADECDINSIMARYEKTGVMPGQALPNQPPMYLDLTEVPDYRSALEQVMEAQEAFMRLPAKARAEFDNDPAQFVQFAADPANIEQMRSWGLAPPAPEAPGPMKVEVVNSTDDVLKGKVPPTNGD